ncbi:hypothetical protein [Escherichia phage vB-Eco-KMB46]|nr:hypothetical protein [Escherichia phage vB-Eco-KMB46]
MQSAARATIHIYQHTTTPHPTKSTVTVRTKRKHYRYI